MTSQDLTPESFIETARRIEAEIGKVIVGQRDIVRGVLISILAGGHVLLEGVPGLGKTLLVRTLAQALRLEASRVQFTPDLMPADITGTNLIVDEGGTRSFRFQPGPIFANLVLADEINRATPKTQSALLEAMQERRVTIARTSHVLREPFLVLATQNPIEMEGTYPLPEAQLDRFFFKLNVGFPGEEDLVEIATRTTSGETRSARPVADGETIVAMIGMARELPIARPVTHYAARLVLNTHPMTESAPREVKQFVRHGASPRGVQTLVLADEINRATPKTQSALLEAMQERRVTIARTSHVLREPFLVLATQNPIEMEGTYPLPEAQLDRFFFKLNVGFPGEEDLVEIATRTTSGETRSASPVADGEAVVAMIGMARELPIARPVTHYAARLVLNTHPTTEGAPREVKQFVRHGASPRGVQTLVLAGKIRALLEGRFNVAFEDIREVATPALRHRVIMSYEGEAEGLTTDAIVASALAATPQAQ